jgi:non-specific serine/threonine protein kinase/serine/threonine-protein kinase
MSDPHDPAYWRAAKDILADALELPPNERPAFLDTACGDNAALRAELQSWLSAYDPGFLEQPIMAALSAALTDPLRSPFVNARFGAFTILREIGHGGMGTVYLAERSDGEFERRVAIKVSTRGFDSELVRRRFRHERQILAALDHPHVARLLDGGTTPDGLPYFVMEYVEGEPIDRYCASQQLSIEARLKLFCDVCAAVEYAHQRLVVHRDLKPGNVLVTADGVPKLLDFGIAKLLTATDSHGTTAVSALTPEYASPEQIRGEPVTTLSDVYSLGVMLYELLTDTHPYPMNRRDLSAVARLHDGPSPPRPSAAAMRRAGTGAPERPDIARALRGDLDTIVMRAMHRDATRRYPSVHALSGDIQRFLHGEPVTAQPDTMYYRTTKFARRHRWPVFFAAAAFVALVVGTIGFAWQARVATQQRAVADRQSSTVRKLALSLLFDVHDSIASLAGSTRAREYIVTRSLASLDALAAENTGDSDLRRDLAAAYVRVGDVQGEPYRPNLGHTDAALASYRRATALLDPIVAANPADTAARHQLAVAEMKIGAVRLRAREWNEAEVAERRAVTLLTSLLARPTDRTRDDAKRDDAKRDDVLTRSALGTAFEYLGDALAASDDMWSRDRIIAAREAYARSLDVFLDLATTHVGNIAIERSVCAAFSRMGYAYSSLALVTADTASFSRALEFHRRGHERMVQALERDPGDALLRRAVADGQMDMSNVESTRGNLAHALALLDSAGPIFLSLTRADPANAEARRDRAYYLENRGEILVKMKESHDAEQVEREAIVALTMLRRDDVGSIEDFYHLAHAQKLLGDAINQSGDAAGARDAYRQAGQTVARWSRAEPNTVRAARLAAEIAKAQRAGPS